MTSTEAKTPADRARALLEHLFDDFEGWPDWWEEDIATAIAAAQRDALDALASERGLSS